MKQENVRVTSEKDFSACLEVYSPANLLSLSSSNEYTRTYNSSNISDIFNIDTSNHNNIIHNNNNNDDNIIITIIIVIIIIIIIIIITLILILILKIVTAIEAAAAATTDNTDSVIIINNDNSINKNIPTRNSGKKQLKATR